MEIKKYIQFITEESGIKSSEIENISSAIGDYLKTLTPHFTFEESVMCNGEGIDSVHCRSCDGSGQISERDFRIEVAVNDGNYGKQVQVMLITSDGCNFGSLSLDFKQYNFIMEIRDSISYVMGGNVIFSGYNYFDKKLMGQKDGRTKTIKDVSEEFKRDVLGIDDKKSTRGLFFYFTVQ